MIFWESDLNFVTVLLDAINLGHLLLQKPNGAGDRRVHAATILVISFVIEYFSVPPDELLNRYREAIPMTCLDIIKWEANLMVSSGVQFETELSLP